MPACGHPLTPDHDGHEVIHLERDDRGTAAGGTPNDVRAILTPEKMSGPSLQTGVKQADTASSHRIAPVGLGPLEGVAQPRG